MERACKRNAVIRRLLSNKGIAPMKSLVIVFIILMIFAFGLDVFTIYTIANNVRTSIDRSVISVAAVNKDKIFTSMREGNTYLTDASVLVTDEEIIEVFAQELGLRRDGMFLFKDKGMTDYYYRISNLKTIPENLNSQSPDRTVAFVTTMTLEVPVGTFWQAVGLDIPITVHSKYTLKD